MLFSKENFTEKLRGKPGLNIIIVGCGTVGRTLVERLSNENHAITVIDTDADSISEITNQYDVLGIVGNGASFSIQREAGITDADLIIAVTEKDELNLLCCTVASRVADCAAIARVCNPAYSTELEHIKDKLGLAMIINPEQEAAREINRILSLPTALEVNSFAHGRAEIVKIVVPQNNMLDGMTVADLGKMTEDVLVCAIERNGELYIPAGDFVISSGDIMSFVAPSKKISDFLKLIGFKTNKVKNAIIIGGDGAGYYLSKMLISNGIAVKIIEKDKALCEQLSAEIPKAVIINGSGSDEELLLEEGLSSCESFVTLTQSDEENILLTLNAKQKSSAKLVTEINRTSFKDAVKSLDLGSVVYPRYITTESIIAYVRAKRATVGSNVETIYHLFENRAEAIEFKIDKESKVTNTPLMNLKLKDNLLICFISRGGKIIIPSGQDSILPGDNVMIVTTHGGFNDIRDILD